MRPDKRFDIRTNRLVTKLLSYVSWPGVVLTVVLVALALFGTIGWFTPTIAVLILVRAAPLYLGIRYGLYVIFHERRVDLRIPGEKGKIRLPYERIVAFRPLPGEKVEIAYLLASDVGHVEDNLRSVTFWPEDAIGLLNELSTRIDRFNQMGWAPRAA